MSEENNPYDVAEVVRQNTAPKLEKIGDIDYAIVPKGMTIESLKHLTDEHKDKPDRREGTTSLSSTASFIEYTNRFKGENTVIFGACKISDDSHCERITAGFTTIFDYHKEGGSMVDADYKGYRAKQEIAISRELKSWLRNDNSKMDQAEFSHFLEDRLPDMAAPNEDDKAKIAGLSPKFADPITILELSRDLEIYANESVTAKNRLQSGEVEIKFTSEHVDGSGKPITIPDFFVVAVPIFEGGDRIRIPVRLRYRLGGGSVKWFYEMYKVDDALHEGFQNAIGEVIEATQLPFFDGTAPSSAK